MEFIKESFRELYRPGSRYGASIVRRNPSPGTPYINKSFYIAPSRSAGEVKIMHRSVEVVTIANSEMQSEILSSTASSSGTHTFADKQEITKYPE